MTASLTITYGAVNLCSSPYLIEFGTDLGAPQNEANPLAFLLQDGEIELSSRASNRTLQFNVLIEGASLTALATAEAALVAESEKVLNTITVDPGDGAPAAVYDVYRGQVTFVRDDDWELASMRRYTVTVKAMPFARSATETVTAALPATGTTTTLVNDGSATTNWTGAVSAGVLTGPTVVSGAVKVGTTAALYGTVTVSATLTTSITTSSTKYIAVDWKPEVSQYISPLRAFGDGTELARVADAALPTAGLTRTWFGPVAASSIAVLRIDSASFVGSGGPVPAMIRSLYIDNVNRTDVKPTLGSGRQLLRQIAVGGSARAPGAIAIEHASSSLGDVLAYFYTDSAAIGYSPPLRQYRNAGISSVATTDSSMVSGARDALPTSTSYDVPQSRLASGMHLLMVRMATAAPVTLSWAAYPFIGTSLIGPGVSGSIAIPNTSSAQTIFAVARINLPAQDVDVAGGAFTRITLTAGTSTLDEAWLFNISVGQLVQVSCGTGAPASGGSANRLFIEPASVIRPRPSVRIGFASDKSDAFYPTSLQAWQAPLFVPPLVNAFTVTTNALDASVSLRGYSRWHTNPAS